MSTSLEQFIADNEDYIQSLDDLTNLKPFSLEGRYIAKVTDVYDGDTCRAALIGIMDSKTPYEFRIRMLLYNAEEIKQSTKLDQDTRARLHTIALNQKQKLMDLILGQVVVIDCKKFDAFGRLLSFVYRPGDPVSINERMIEAFPDIKRVPFE